MNYTDSSSAPSAKKTTPAVSINKIQQPISWIATVQSQGISALEEERGGLRFFFSAKRKKKRTPPNPKNKTNEWIAAK